MPGAGSVQGGGRLVEDQDRRVAEDGAGDGDPLPLPAGQQPSSLAGLGGVAAGSAAMNSCAPAARAAATTSASSAPGLP